MIDTQPDFLQRLAGPRRSANCGPVGIRGEPKSPRGSSPRRAIQTTLVSDFILALTELNH